MMTLIIYWLFCIIYMTAGLLTYRYEDPVAYSASKNKGKEILGWSIVLIFSPIIMPIILGNSHFYSQEVNEHAYDRLKENKDRLFKDDK